MWAISSDVKLLNFPRIWSSVKWRGRRRSGWVILYRRVLLWGLKLYAGVSSIWLIVGHKNECVSSLCNQASYLFLKYNEKCKCHKPHNARLYFCDNHILSLQADFLEPEKRKAVTYTLGCWRASCWGQSLMRPQRDHHPFSEDKQPGEITVLWAATCWFGVFYLAASMAVLPPGVCTLLCSLANAFRQVQFKLSVPGSPVIFYRWCCITASEHACDLVLA